MNGKDVIVWQSVSCGETDKLFTIVPGDAAALRRKPHDAILVAINVQNSVVSQAIKGIISPPCSFFEGSEAEVNTSDGFTRLNCQYLTISSLPRFLVPSSSGFLFDIVDISAQDLTPYLIRSRLQVGEAIST